MISSSYSELTTVTRCIMYIVINEHNSEFKNKPMIYGLADPDTLKIRYVGKSIQGTKRYRDHLTPSGLKNDKNTHKANWINSLLRLGKKPSFVILSLLSDTGLTKEEINTKLYDLEKEFIEFYKKDLTNHQDAGPGSPNRKTNEATRKKMSENAKKRGLPKALVEQQKKKLPLDTETQRFCSNCLKYLNFDNFKSIKRNNHTCRACWRLCYQKSKAIPGARDKFNNTRKHPVEGFNEKETVKFNGMRDAAKVLGGTSSKTGIYLAIKNNTRYRGYFWRKV